MYHNYKKGFGQNLEKAVVKRYEIKRGKPRPMQEGMLSITLKIRYFCYYTRLRHRFRLYTRPRHRSEC